MKTFWIVIASLLALMLAMRWQFPDMLAHPDQWLRVLYLVALLGLVAGGARMRYVQQNPSQAMRHALLWVIIIAGLVFFYELMRILRAG